MLYVSHSNHCRIFCMCPGLALRLKLLTFIQALMRAIATSTRTRCLAFLAFFKTHQQLKAASLIKHVTCFTGELIQYTWSTRFMFCIHTWLVNSQTNLCFFFSCTHFPFPISPLLISDCPTAASDLGILQKEQRGTISICFLQILHSKFH